MMWIDDPLVRIRPLTPDRYEELRALEQAVDRDGLWRFAGGVPEPDAYVPTLWANVAGHCALYTHGGRLVGSVMVYDADLRNGTAWIAILVDPEVQGRGIGLVGAGHVVTDLFRNWRLRRVCAEVLEPNLAHFANSYYRHATEYGRLRGDRLVGDRLVDVVLLGMDRDVWRREYETWLLDRRLPPGTAPAPDLYRSAGGVP